MAVAGKGLGVFAAADFAEGDTVEVSPVLTLPTNAYSPELQHHVLEWLPDERLEAIGMGYLMLYNHGTRPNVGFERLFACRAIRVFARRSIALGEELTIDYGDPWFEVVD